MLSYYPKPMPKPSTMNRVTTNMLESAEKAYIKSGGNRARSEILQWKQHGQIAPGYTPVAKLPQAALSEGVFWDADEDARVKNVQKKARLGKGTPKKGKCRIFAWIISS